MSHSHYINTVLSLILLFCDLGDSAKTFFFQPDNIPTNESRATLFMTPLPGGPSEIKSFSLSVWFNVHFFRESTYLFSYAISDENSNMLNLYMRPDKIVISLGRTVSNRKRKPVQVNPRKWYNLGVAVNQTEEAFQVYLNGEIMTTGEIPTIPMPLNGSLVLGQETDAYNGGFVPQQSFSGRLSGFNLYGRILTSEEFKAIFECDADLNPGEGDIVSWSTASWDLQGSVDEEDVEVCQRKETPYTIMAKQLNFAGSRFMCERLFKTDVYLPLTSAQNDQLYNDSETFISICKPQNHGFSYFWLGATDEVENGVWRNLEGEILNFTNFRTGSRSSSQKCAAYDIIPYIGSWNDVLCESLTFCCSCVNPLPTTNLRIRGLCEDKETSNMFKVGDMSPEGVRDIEGFTRYTISFNKSNHNWYLHDMWTQTDLASHFDYSGSYPIGMRNWELLADYVVCELPKGQKKTLTLSACNSEEFTCRDGSCVPLPKRCDLITDCRDSSDENDCQKLRLPQDYMKGLPPAGTDGNALNVNVSIVIEKLSEIDVRNMKLRMDFIIIMEWYDPRLTYANLNEMDDINLVNVNEVWTPETEYINADFPSVHQMTPSLTIRRESNPNKDENSRHLRDNLYAGHLNPLILDRRVSSHFGCLMYLEYFPFDTQQCQIVLRLKSARVTLVKWGNVEVTYLGETRLSEYEIGRTNAIIEVENEFSTGVVSIVLTRRYAYYVTTLYLPTFMMLLISWASLFCRKEDNELRIMMTITTLLVLYSLYQQISNGLPKTSYAKAADIWCFFALTVIFTQVLFHVLVDVNIPYFLRRLGSTVKIQERIFFPVSDKRETALRKSRIVYFVFMILFTVGYFSFVGYHMINS